MFIKLRKSGLNFNVEDNVAGFFRILRKRRKDGSKPSWANGARTYNPRTYGGKPKGYTSLPENKEGDPFNANWNYTSVVGMLKYLALNSRPNISFAVHQCAPFMHLPFATTHA
jgi:hypothetical protein